MAARTGRLIHSAAMAILFYYALLALWPLLLWPALRLRGWSRAWLCFVALAGVLATVHEIRIWYGPPSAIRLDILLIAVVLVVLYASAVAVLFRSRWRKTAATVGLVVVLAGGGLATAWIEAGREGERLSVVFKARNALLFEAKFRNFDTYADYFQMFDARPTDVPVGHWEAEVGGGYFSRLIVNPEGRVWAFFPCDETECDYQSVEPGLQPVGDSAGRQWEVTLKPMAGLPVTVQIAQPDPDHLTVEGRGQPSTLAKIPPPIDPAPPRESLVYLGPFSQADCRGQYADLRQLWFWQEDNRLYAIGIVSTLVAGKRADFVSPMVMGVADRQGDTWSFDWQHNDQTWSATVTLEGPDAKLTLARDGEPLASTVLARDAVFHDEVIALAPRTSEADWNHWFETVLVGHFSSGDVPAC